jgi:hypothetical protein
LTPQSARTEQPNNDNWLNLNALKWRLIYLTENLHDLPKKSLEKLWNVAEQVDIAKLLNSADLLLAHDDFDDGGFLSTTPPSTAIELADCGNQTPPATPSPSSRSERHGKRWEGEEIEGFERMLRMDNNVSLVGIAKHFGRSKNSIELKAASLIDKKINSGCDLEMDLQYYKYKISREAFRKYVKLKERGREMEIIKKEAGLPK